MKTISNAPLAALLLAVLATGCGGEPAKVEPPPDPVAAVTFYRPHSDLHAADYPFTYMDGERKGQLADNAALSFFVQGGRHKMSLSNPALWEADQFWQFNAVAGRHYYFRLRLGDAEGDEGTLPRYVSRFARVDEVPEKTALTEIAAMQAPAKE